MKQLNKIVMLVAAAAMATAAGAQTIDNWRAADGTVWKNGTNEHCWRDANWTPATAAATCDGAIVAKPAVGAPAAGATAAASAAATAATAAAAGIAAAAAAAPAAAPAAPAAPAVPAAAVAPSKVTYAADAFFDFDKAVLKPEGKAKLSDLASKVAGINLEVVIAVGHTDSTGPAKYNQALSVRRAEAVKAYLVSKGIESNRIYTEGKGLTQPIADNSTREGRAKNRRVEVEVVGTRRK
ncbi:MAG: hypothetical protein RLZZ352_1692 [Pseudomonadota bacterium]